MDPNVRCSCEGVDGCKDAVVRCNNDFFPCEVNCVGEKAWASTTIEGPAGAALTAMCTGEFSCEGNIKVNGAAGTDMSVHCDGMTSCKGHAVLEYGVGRASLNCNGDPDSCQGVVINLPSNAYDLQGMAFQCNGLFCPAYAPPAFRFVVCPSISRGHVPSDLYLDASFPRGVCMPFANQPTLDLPPLNVHAAGNQSDC